MFFLSTIENCEKVVYKKLESCLIFLFSKIEITTHAHYLFVCYFLTNFKPENYPLYSLFEIRNKKFIAI